VIRDKEEISFPCHLYEGEVCYLKVYRFLSTFLPAAGRRNDKEKPTSIAITIELQTISESITNSAAAYC
jgi:hypothetical protein